MSETLRTQVLTFIKNVCRKGTKETITVAMPRVPVYRPEIAPGHSNTNCIPLLLPGSTASHSCALKGQSVAI
jgi:hypothetical protein